MNWAFAGRRWLCVVGSGLSFELSACGGSTVSTGPSLSPLEDCRLASPNPSSTSSGGSVEHANLTIDGKLRDYRLFRPSAHAGEKPVPMVIALHGTPMSADDFAMLAHFDDEAATAGFLAVYPNGCQGGWGYPDGEPKAPQVDFISKVIDQVERTYQVDTKRMFVVGVSAGSVMAYRLACDLSNQIAAIASVSGAMKPDDCSPTRPVSVLEMHGTEDCWGGGCPHPELLGVDTLNQRWRTIDGCTGDPTISQVGITTTSLWRCKDGSVVRLDAIAGGHHTWFGSSFDPVPGEPDANKTIWSFFNSLQQRA